MGDKDLKAHGGAQRAGGSSQKNARSAYRRPVRGLATGAAVALLIAILGTAGSSAHAASQETYKYDAAGRLVEATLGDKAIRYTYDAAGNVLERKVVPVPEADAVVVLLGALVTLRSRRRWFERPSA